jgi:hypothetical protein
LLVATLWAGSLWAVGYLAAPTLFATLSDRVLAGTIAASLFKNQAWLSIACALVMLVLLWATNGTGGIFAGSAANMAAKARRTADYRAGDAGLYAGVAFRPAADDGVAARRGGTGRRDGRRRTQ